MKNTIWWAIVFGMGWISASFIKYEGLISSFNKNVEHQAKSLNEIVYTEKLAGYSNMGGRPLSMSVSVSRSENITSMLINLREPIESEVCVVVVSTVDKNFIMKIIIPSQGDYCFSCETKQFPISSSLSYFVVSRKVE